jgi:hypothetical protein
MFGGASIIPFFCLHVTNPAVALGMYSGLLMTLCIVESLFTTILQDFMPGNEETAPLLNDRISYDTVSNAVDTNYPKAY